jgi:hypothetical protein
MRTLLREEVLPPELKLLFARPIVFSICFNVILKLIILFIVSTISQDEFYGFYFGPFLVLEIFSHAWVAGTPLERASWTFEDFDVATSLNVWIRCGVCYKGSNTNLKIVNWKIINFWIFVAYIIAWFYPLGLFTSATGVETVFGISYAGKSSCQSNAGAEGTFNPKGVFPVGSWLRFSSDASYTFCPLDQQWASPNLDQNTVIGYTYYPNSFFVNCQNPVIPGFIGACDGSYDISFPDKTLGIPGPIVAGSSTTETEFCPGNTPLPNCFNRNGQSITCTYCNIRGTRCFNVLNEEVNCDICTVTSVPGRPEKICPVCLNYYRWMSGDWAGPGTDYTHCPRYNPNAANNIFCYYCPGRGHGWHPNAKFTTDILTTVFWLMTTFVFFVPFTDFIIFTAWVQSIKNKRFKIK